MAVKTFAEMKELLINGTNLKDIVKALVGSYGTRGATSVADNATIAHGLPYTPTTVIVTCSTADEYASVSAIAATTFTVQLTKHDGSAGTTAVVYWAAW